jgi:type II secretory pathway component GspD/PulD (secretin)
MKSDRGWDFCEGGVMSEPKFTPGPWFIPDHASGFEIESSCNKQIAKTSQLYAVKQASDHDERRANAHLIAAAPELYEALEKLEGWFDSDSKESADKYLKKAKAARAKARGEI